MPRPKKYRKVCHYPKTQVFQPVGSGEDQAPVMLSVDEYETIRLIDQEGFSQEQCGEYMRIARTTVQLIYASARKKLADMLVDGRKLYIEGGDYQLCNGEETFCGCGECFKAKFNKEYKIGNCETSSQS